MIAATTSPEPTVGLVFLGIASWIILFVIRLTRTRRARAQGY